MRHRILVIGIATLLAFVVLGLTFLAGESAPRKTESQTPVAPGSTPLGFDSSRATSRITQRFTPVTDAKEYRFEKLNRKGQLLQLFGQSLTPLPEGVSAVLKPMVRLHSSSHRVLEIKADRGSFIAPENQPRSGEFSDNVVLTIYESPRSRNVDLSPESKDVKLRAYLQDARFDLQLGQIDSNGIVHLTSDRVDFRGRGLSLTYNELRGRLDRLEVPQGRQLRIKTQNPKSPAATQPQTQAASMPGNKSETEGVPLEPLQFYRARIEQRVRIKSPELQADGQMLELIFSLNTRSRKEMFEDAGFSGSTPAPAPAPNSKPSTTQPEPAAPLIVPQGSLQRSINSFLLGSEAVAAETSEESLPTGLGPSLAPISPDDLIITWDGRLLVEPEDSATAMDLRVAEDFYVALSGRPARIVTARQELITLTQFDYLSHGRRVRLTGDQQIPLVIDSPQLGGVLRGQRLTLFQSEGTGELVGAGSLKAYTDTPLGERAAVNRQGLPPGSVVTWQERLDLTFYLRDDARMRRSDPNQIRALRSISFVGDVSIDSPEFDLRAERLGIGLDEPEVAPSTSPNAAALARNNRAAFGGQKQTVNSIKASGSVKIANRSSEASKQLAIESEDLVVDLQKNKRGQVEPRRLIAGGNVRSVQAGRVLNANYLDVFLDPQPESSATRTATTAPASSGALGQLSDTKVAIRYLLARENVHVELDNPAVVVDCNRLVADVEADQLELFGWDDRPAKLTHAHGSLAGPYIVMGQRDQTAHAFGPGTFTFTQQHELNKSPVTMKVDFAQVLHFDNRQGYAHFLGQVFAQGGSGRDSSTLRCEDLKIEFTPLGERAPLPRQVGIKALGTNRTSGAFLSSGDRALRTLTARTGVVLTAQQTNEAGSEVLTRLRIEGPMLTFDNSKEQMQIVGPGMMLTEDYRQVNPLGQRNAVAFNAGGATLFTWQGMMLADFFNNDLRLEEKVAIMHRAIGARKPVQIDAQKFWADMESSGGIGGFVGKNTVKPRLMSVLADGNVRFLTEDAAVFTDHMRYTGTTQEVKLFSDAGRLTRMQIEGQPAESRAQAFKAQFRDGRLSRIEIDRPEPGPVPVPRR